MQRCAASSPKHAVSVASVAEADHTGASGFAHGDACAIAGARITTTDFQAIRGR